MRRALPWVIAAVALLAAAAPAGASSAVRAYPVPKTTLPDVEDEVMCTVCGTALNLSSSPQADRERAFIRREIAAGKTKDQIKADLVAQYGNQVLWNGAYDDAGRLLGLPAGDVPEQPKDVVLCESIRRFKGLERPVIVMLEVPRDDPERLDRLLYIGASRAMQHLVVIVPLAVVRRLTTLSS